MYMYGRKWYEALRKILIRLALDEGYGFLIVEGPDASGKTDLMNLVGEIAEKASAIEKLQSEETRKLGQLVHARRYLKIDLGCAECWGSIPTRTIGKLIDAVSSNGARPEQRFLIMWDDIDKTLDTSSEHEGTNRRFLEEIHRPLQMYEHMTFLCTVTAVPGEGREVLGITAGPNHFLQL